MCAVGFKCLEPVETPAGGVGYRPEHDLSLPGVQQKYLKMARSGYIGGAHCGIPCTTWGSLHNGTNGGTRRRHLPLGDGTRADEEVGNNELTFLIKFIKAMLSGGGWVTIEHPRNSLIQHHPVVANWLKRGVLNMIVFDQCTFGLGSPPGAAEKEIWKKSTMLLSTCIGFEKMAVRCDGRHAHTTIWDRIRVHGKLCSRATLAGRYPDKLCRAYASCAHCFCHATESKPRRRSEEPPEHTA